MTIARTLRLLRDAEEQLPGWPPHSGEQLKWAKQLVRAHASLSGRIREMAGQVEFDQAKLARLRRQYAEAVAAGDEVFIFEDGGQRHEILTSFAKYMIEHLAGRLR